MANYSAQVEYEVGARPNLIRNRINYMPALVISWKN